MSRTDLKKVCVCGHFGLGRELVNGQTIKTKIITTAMQELAGEDQVLLWDTHGGAKALLRLPGQCIRMLGQCGNIVILPAQNGLRVIAPLLAVCNLVYRRGLHYCVIGGWLPGFLEKRKLLARALKAFDGIHVETATMKNALEAMGFRNIRVMPNCKAMQAAEREVQVSAEPPYRLCTFSRVMREKGIEDAVSAVRAVNVRLGRTVYTLDIYGPVESGQKEWFEALRGTFPAEIAYRGTVDPERSVQALGGSLALLFPTRFYTEGIPGTVIDAYMAGIPVIAARWESFADTIDEGVTGLGYPFGDAGALEELLLQLAGEPERLRRMAPACLEKAKTFSAAHVVGQLLRALH